MFIGAGPSFAGNQLSQLAFPSLRNSSGATENLTMGKRLMR